MASVNKVIVLGNMGADPEMRYMQNGDAVCNIKIATSESWKDKQTGEKKEATEWHRVVFFRQLAEIAGKYLNKGASVYVEGSLKTRKWTDKDGIERYTTEITGNEMKMLGGRQDSDAPRQQESWTAQSAKPAAKQSASFADMDDDIPF